MNSKSIIVTVVIALILGGAGFYGGTMYEKNSLSSQGLLRSANAGAQGGRQFGAGQGGQGGQRMGGGANGANGGFTTGQITAQDNTSITVKMRDGSSKIVFFSSSTSIGKSTSGATSDLAAGQTVMVSGTNNSDGSIAAQSIQIRPDQPNQNGQTPVPSGN
jgi:hypothetical protein